MCVIFGLAFLSGGIASAVYAADNSDLHDRFCDFSSSGICGDLETVYQSEAATAVSSICCYIAIVMSHTYVAIISCTYSQGRLIRGQGAITPNNGRFNIITTSATLFMHIVLFSGSGFCR